MSNASATTITVNTALFAAGDTVQITNLGAGVCTITAGTATVNSSASLALAQYESGTLDFISTSAAIFIKGAGAAASSSPTSASAKVATNQGTTSSSYTDLTTSGPAVTLTTGTKALVIISAEITSGAVNQGGRMSFAVSGASTIAASDAVSYTYIGANTDFHRASSVTRVTTLTAGSNTFTSKYVSYYTNNVFFQNREIIVIDLGS